MRIFFVTNDLIFRLGAETAPHRLEAVADSMANEKFLQSRGCRAEAHPLRAGAALDVKL